MMQPFQSFPINNHFEKERKMLVVTDTEMDLRQLTVEEKECLFCNRTKIDEFKYGPLIQKNNIVVHYYCLLFSYALEQNGKDSDGIYGFLERDILETLAIMKKNCCCYCTGTTASVKCSKLNCSAVFHYPCGVENGSMHQFTGRFNSFCFVHRPKKRIDRRVQLEARKTPPVCPICFELVDSGNSIEAIWASCCRLTWYHRDCLQRFALSAGFLFKCVICRDSRKFKKLVKRNGLYLPRRDATWETCPGAFQELYIRYKQCDMECKCPMGRSYEDGEDWELVLCGSCASQGVHVQCGDLRGRAWECEVCRKVW